MTAAVILMPSRSIEEILLHLLVDVLDRVLDGLECSSSSSDTAPRVPDDVPGAFAFNSRWYAGTRQRPKVTFAVDPRRWRLDTPPGPSYSRENGRVTVAHAGATQSRGFTEPAPPLDEVSLRTKLWLIGVWITGKEVDYDACPDGPEVGRSLLEGVLRGGARNTPSMQQPSTLGEPWKPLLSNSCYLPIDLRNRRNLARGGYSSRPVPDLRGQARLRPPFTSFCTAGGDELARRGGSDRGGEVAGGPSCSTQPVEGRPVALRKAPAGGDRVWYRPPGTAPQGTRRARAQSNL